MRVHKHACRRFAQCSKSPRAEYVSYSYINGGRRGLEKQTLSYPQKRKQRERITEEKRRSERARNADIDRHIHAVEVVHIAKDYERKRTSVEASGLNESPLPAPGNTRYIMLCGRLREYAQ